MLGKIRKDAKNPRDLGDKFEDIVLDVLKTAPVYKARFDKVWKWSDWAMKNDISEIDRTMIDRGIDIVARESNSGRLCAVQCKCYEKTIEQKDVDGFIAEASARQNHGFATHIFAHTSSLNVNASDRLEAINAHIIDRHVLNHAIDWSQYPKPPVRAPPKTLRDYQSDALRAVTTGLADGGRGQMIMACGTGKTLVALRIAEKMVGVGGTVLYIVPSISLIQQSMHEWAANAELPFNYISVCSDRSVARRLEQGTASSIPVPVTTDADYLIEQLCESAGNKKMNVIFSTYNSIGVVGQAAADSKVKKSGILDKSNKIHMVFADEAHRTTGIDAEKTEKKFYTAVHEDSRVPAARRLYMTATPRIYHDSTKARATKKKMTAISMDDEAIYGKKLYHLSFHDAVHKYKALCDFKIFIAYMDGDTMSYMTEGRDEKLPLKERSLCASIWDGIKYARYYGDNPKDGREQPDATKDSSLLQRVIMFCTTINSSKLMSGIELKYNKDITENSEKLERAREEDAQRSFVNMVSMMKDITSDKSRDNVDVKHVDGAHNAVYRAERLDWLKTSESESPNTCRILTNARCLSEGVDVPALDGVVFVNPRKSVVDVVQAVGRVMRKAPGKEFGYVILPVGIPTTQTVDKVLKNDKHFDIVWQVLNALKSHDPRLVEEVSRLTLEPKPGDGSDFTNRIMIHHAIGRGWENLASIKKMGAIEVDRLKQTHIDNHIAIKEKIIKHTADREFYDKYGQKLGEASLTIEDRITNRIKTDKTAEKTMDELTNSLQGLINNSVTLDATIKIVAQHIVLSRVFDMLFQGDFTSNNPISHVLNNIIHKIGMQEELRDLDDFYKDVERSIALIDTREARQAFIKKIYGNFLESADEKSADKHGVVYTPIEVIDFIINSVQHVLKTEFGTEFNDRQVKVLEPFAGTGTFITRLLESGLITDNLYKKYKHDLHANEMILLAFYIAAVNIETTYKSLSPSNRHVPFDGINFVDTLGLHPKYRDMSGITGVLDKNTKNHRVQSEYTTAQSKIDQTFMSAHGRIRNQKRTHLHVIMSNPPYSAGQKNLDDNNPNLDYPDLDEMIKATYVASGSKGNKNSIYDSYIRALRWASSRIGNSGVIAFITNAAFLRSDAGTGIRACLAKEFTDVWCFDLRGNARTQGESRKKENGNIFGEGSRAPVAITILVKNAKKKGCTIHYRDIGDYLSQKQKLDMIRNLESVNGIVDWETIQSDKYNDWLDQRLPEFEQYMPIGSDEAKAGRENAIFRGYSLGLKTTRDVWAYNCSKDELFKNMTIHIKYCNNQNLDNPKIDATQGTWAGGLVDALKKYGVQKPDSQKIRFGLYRPFFKQWVYYDKVFNSAQYKTPMFFPQSNSKNIVICLPDKGRIGMFSAMVTDTTPDFHIIEQSQCFPLYTYDIDGSNRRDNITDTTLKLFQKFYNNKKITKKHIFTYVYGILHHEPYRKKFANNLSKELPRIPFAPSFWGFCNAGKELMDLHLNYDKGTKHNLGKPKFTLDKFTKLSFGRKTIQQDKKTKQVKDTTTICGDDGNVIFSNIPVIKYLVNGRTPIEWMVDRYNRQEDKGSEKKQGSGIINDPLEQMTGQEVIDLIRRLVHVGVDSDRIISKLPKEFEPKDWDPSMAGLGDDADGDPAQSKLV